ncbi:hypothetical protein [Gordonia rubripertincta]|uniref:Rv0361 family membrane protein n=1 Tax=Gordonia rubripertincta TaxID=36822 RepID=UPI0015F8C2FD|nr:hypothetical protein [Gordonia rubripertincta]QMU21216.1 hypothetical protein H3V45_01440 [Gordonia rubripertincta]
MARSDKPRAAVTKALSTLRQVRDERRARRNGQSGAATGPGSSVPGGAGARRDPSGRPDAGPGETPATAPSRPPEPATEAGSRPDTADTTPDTVRTGDDAENQSTSREGHEPAVDDPTQNDTAENRADDAADTGKNSSDAQTPARKAPATAPKPKGGRGIDGATQIISRDNLPSPEDLEDLDSIDPLGTDDADTPDPDTSVAEDTPAEPVSKPARLGPSDSQTTVIRREDLPDPSELEDLDDIDVTSAAPEPEAEPEEPAEIAADEPAEQDVTAESTDGEEPGTVETGAVETGTAEATDEAETDETDGSGAGAAAVAAGAVGATAVGAAAGGTDEADEATPDEADQVDAAAESEEPVADAESGPAADDAEDADAAATGTEDAVDAADEVEEPTAEPEPTEPEVAESEEAEPEKAEPEVTEPETVDADAAGDTGTDDEVPAEAPTEAMSLAKVEDDPATAAPEDEPADDSDAATKVIPAAAAAAAGAAAAGAKAATPDERTDTVPEPAVTAPSTGEWTTTTHQPQVIPGSKPSKATKKRGKGPLIAVVALLVVLVAAIGGIFAYQNMTATPPADEAAEVALDYTTALYEGDLETLRSVTCGELHAFYEDFDDAAYRKTYDAQKARNELVQTQAINAVRVVEGGDLAVVEVVAVHTSSPETPETVTLNLQREGDAWKVCNPT